MKFDEYMPFDGNKFFAACIGQNPNFPTWYLKAIWYYWHHTHCSGLRDDDGFLREVCGVPVPQWREVKDVMFSGEGEFFFQAPDGKWHQKHAMERWQKLEQRSSTARTLAERRWGR